MRIIPSGNQGGCITFVFFLKQIAWYMNHSMKPVHTYHHSTPLNKTKNLYSLNQEDQFCAHVSFLGLVCSLLLSYLTCYFRSVSLL